ncbi:MAG: hypothetical protein H0T89_07990 [Deltaproteobacteria bacterium]|nr:hypothetical protein [Deltaproteobacteria bacterium]MDQ3298407.1 hypothetical protein [Myxococcota bacterium]
MNLSSLVLSSVFLVACGKSDDPKPAPKAVEPATATAGSAGPAPAMGTEKTGGVPGSENLAPLAGLMAQLETEAKSRPAAKVTAERAFEAIKAAGLEVGEPQQVLGKTALAKYCAAARIEPAIGVSVCEYETAEQAKAGGAFMDKNFKGLAPDAARVINGTTLLTVANATGHEDVRKRVLALFKSL